MDLSRLSKSILRHFLAFFALLLFVAAWAQAQKHEGAKSSAPPPHPSNNSTASHGGGGSTGGGSNTNTRGSTGSGTGSGNTAHNPYGGTAGSNARTNTGTGTSTATTAHNPYGNVNGGSSSGKNPYGSYGNAPNKGGATAGGATGTGNSSRSPYGSYGKSATAGGTGREAGKFGSGGGAGAGSGSGKFGSEGRNTEERGGLRNGAGGNNGFGGHGNESRSLTRADGSRATFNGAGHTTRVMSKTGTETRFNSSGRVSSIHTANGMTVMHGSRGGRTIVSERADHSRVVSMGGRRGYVEHPYSRGGRSYMRRTYWDHGHYYAHAYRGYYWHGNRYWGYAPAYYYGVGFYGWAYSPWASPVAYSWGWGGSPWYGYYGNYFTPYPVYATPSLWLTDYVISQNLQAAYDAQQNDNGGGQGQAPQQGGGQQGGGDQGVALTPEVKQQIADEVKMEIAADKAAAAAPQAQASGPADANGGGGGDQLPGALDPDFRTFVVSTPLSEMAPDGSNCNLSPGDVVNRIDDTPDQNQKVDVLVSNSETGDCTAGLKLQLGVDDLQDMRNHFREQVDAGLKTLADNKGKNGLPNAPDTRTTPVADGQADPDANAQSDIQQQQQAANQAEQQAPQAQ